MTNTKTVTVALRMVRTLEIEVEDGGGCARVVSVIDRSGNPAVREVEEALGEDEDVSAELDMLFLGEEDL